MLKYVEGLQGKWFYGVLEKRKGGSTMKKNKSVFEAGECILLQERQEAWKSILAAARKFSDRYQIDQKVIPGRLGMQLQLCCHDMLFTKYMLKDLAEFFLLFDDMSITTKTEENYDYILSLNYYKHEVYVDGKQVRLWE